MPTVETDVNAVRRQLDEVLAASLFARSEQLSRLLRFIVVRHLDGRDDELKESVIAVEVFGRAPDYDPRRDPIVRTEARRLRSRLNDYYSTEGVAAPIIIELPKGGYVPLIRVRESIRETPPTAVTTKDAARGLPGRLFWAAGAVMLAAVGTLGWWSWVRNTAPIPIAVLPLENLNHNPAEDYFADGLTDEIIRNLAILDGLAVRSQTSSFAFKGKPRNIREAASQLGADYILEGSVLRAGEHLRVNVQLVRAREDTPIWSGRYDSDVTDVFKIQDEISRGIVNSLRLKLGRGRRRYETSVEAYDLYLRGRAMIRYGFSGYRTSVPLFEAAIAKDPSFAPAYAGLAMDEVILSGWFVFAAPEVLARMRTAAQKAVELDPLSAEAITAQALADARDARWNEAERGFRRAIELEPNNSIPHSQFAIQYLEPLGRIDEALRELRTAETNDPLSPEVYQRLANVLIVLGRYEEAARYAERMPADSTLRPTWLGRARFFQGRTDEALRILASGDEAPAYLGFAYARLGRRAEAEQVVARLQDPLGQAIVFAALGDKDRSIQALERSIPQGPVHFGRVLAYPEMALVRNDPRVRAIRKKLGLPD